MVLRFGVYKINDFKGLGVPNIELVGAKACLNYKMHSLV